MINDSTERYGSISRFFHWLMAFLIGWQLLKFFDRIADGEHWVGQVMVPWHISIGTVALVLVVLRMSWAVRQKNNRPAQGPATAALVKVGHFLLYAGMFLMPVTGIFTMLGNGYGWAPFGIDLVAKGNEISWMASFGRLHSPIAWTLLVLIVGHVGAALLHHVVKRDGILRRIL